MKVVAVSFGFRWVPKRDTIKEGKAAPLSAALLLEELFFCHALSSPRPKKSFTRKHFQRKIRGKKTHTERSKTRGKEKRENFVSLSTSVDSDEDICCCWHPFKTFHSLAAF